MIYVLDSSAFIFSFSISPSATAYTTEEVIQEVSRNRFVKLKIEIYTLQGSLKVLSPPSEYLSKVSLATADTADFKVLSKADLSVIALALYLKENMDKDIVLITDDYSLQNIAYVLGIKFKSMTVKGITKKIKWMIYCPACGKVVKDSKMSICPICGHQLRRKATEKASISS